MIHRSGSIIRAAVLTVVFAALWVIAVAKVAAAGHAAVHSAARLTGSVSSDTEGPMTGVLITAKPAGSTMTVAVISDSRGRYEFPADRLLPGSIQLSIRAVGYDLQDTSPVSVIAGQVTTRDLKLKATANLAAQLSNAEWLASIAAGPTGLKRDAFDPDTCSHCHTFRNVTNSSYTAEQWVTTLERMRLYSQNASPNFPHLRPSHPANEKYWGKMTGSDYGRKVPTDLFERGRYLATINRSTTQGEKWPYKLKTEPRPSGDESKAIFTIYDLPRPGTQPHDVQADAEGFVWYLDFGQNFLGRLDPKTGRVMEWPIPMVKPYPPFAPGGLDLELDAAGNPWMGMMHQNAFFKFDRKTEKFKVWEPESNNMETLAVMVEHDPAHGVVWLEMLSADLASSAFIEVDAKTEQIKRRIPAFAYSIEAIKNGNLVTLGRDAGLHELDTKTGKLTPIALPTPKSFPRRGATDTQGRVWFAEYFGGNIGMYDPETRQVKEWKVGVPFADPYDLDVAPNGDVWTGGEVMDWIVRLNPATGRTTKYLSPIVDTNVRRIDVDKYTSRTTIWFGATHSGKIVRLEPLE